MALIYIAEDDEDIREVIAASLGTFRYETKTFPDGLQLVNACLEQAPDCVLLDIMMPVMDGITALRKLRTYPATKNLPILLLTAKTAEMDIVSGLEAGADDYITKPFVMLELGARVKAALRAASRYSSGEEGTGRGCRTIGPVSVDDSTHSVLVDGGAVSLTLKEYNLLSELMKASPGVVSREELLKKVWGYDFAGESRTLDMHIRSLRVKLTGYDLITTIRGVGYRFLWEESKG